MNDCQKIETQLFAYLDKELDAKIMIEIEQHLELCRGCFDHAEFEKVLRQFMQKKTDHMCPEKLKNRIKEIIDRF